MYVEPAGSSCLSLNSPHQNHSSLGEGPQSSNVHISLSNGAALLTPCPTSLPLEFYDQNHDHHSRWALETFHNWLTVVHPHIHAPTGTVYGGPHGVRHIVFALSRISSAIELSEQKSNFPPVYRRVLGSSRWDSSKLSRQLSTLIMELRRQVARSSSILQISFNERSKAWKQEVERQYRARKLAGTIRPRPLHEARVNMTSGVPSAADALEAIWKAIKPRPADRGVIDESVEASRVLPIVPTTREARFLDSRSDSAEQIDLPRDSEFSEESSGGL